MGRTHRRPLGLSIGILTALIANLVLSGSVAASSSSTTLVNGANLAVSLDSPAAGTDYLVGDTVTASGTASVGVGTPDATIVYIVDQSGSTALPGGACGSVLDCEKAFVIGINDAAATAGSVKNVGLGSFDSAGYSQFGLGAATDPGFNTAVNGLAPGSATNFAAGLAVAVGYFQQATAGSHKFLIFLSDGIQNLGGDGAASLATLTSLGVVSNTFAIGSGSSCTGGADVSLNDIALGGGTCTAVTDPNMLPDLIPNLIGSVLDKVEVSVDGGAGVVVSTTPSTPADGPVSVTYSRAISGLAAGDHEICATATGHDVFSNTPSSTKACETINVLDISLAPATATNELGTPGQTHTVTATIAAGTTVGGRTVSFTIISGPNTGKSGTASTNGSGDAGFTYTATQGTAGLGTDTIKACFSIVSAGNVPETDCATAKKIWRDTTPPAASCVETTNPSGKNVPNSGPNAGKSGQNPDGFYQLIGTDAVGVASIVVKDDGSAFVSDPFASGDKVKITQAPGVTPSDSRPGPGVIVSHLKLKGDAILQVTDTSGNTTEVSCKVAPLPK
jgi:hypothetical protein